MGYSCVLCSRHRALSYAFMSPFASPLQQLTVPLCVPPGGLEAKLSQLGSPLHPFTLQTPHVGGKDAAQTKVLQALLVQTLQLKRLNYTALILDIINKLWDADRHRAVEECWAGNPQIHKINL